MNYEYNMHRHFYEVADKKGLIYYPKTWLAYVPHGGDRTSRCEVDGLMIDIPKGLIFLIEVKVRHCIQAYYQLYFKYSPLVRKMFPDFQIIHCEVCRKFDPMVTIPHPIYLQQDFFRYQPQKMNVCLIK